MATRVTDEFGSRANPPDAAYPDGSLKNETTPGVSNDGSPLDSRVGNDWEGFKQSVLTEAGITANGNPDSVTNPQILDSVKSITDNRFNADGVVYTGLGNISGVVGQSVPDADKKNAYQYPDNSRLFYGPIQDQVFPITIPADPSSDKGWALVNAATNDFVFEVSHAGDVQALNGGIYPKASTSNVSLTAPSNEVPTGVEFVRVNGKLYRLSIPSSGLVTNIDEQNLSITIGGVTSILLPNKFSKSSTVVFSEMTSDPTHLQGVLDWNAGGKVALGFEESYTLTNGEITIPKGSRLDLNGSAFTFDQDGTQRGFIQLDSTSIFNGSVNVIGTPSGGGGDSGSCVSAGNQGTGVGVKGAKAYDLNVDTVKPDGNGIVYFGSCRNCKIERISFPDSATMARVIATEWGGPSTANNNGHPHNNTIKNISGGELTGSFSNSYVVWLSSAFNTDVTNIYSPNCEGLVGVFTGDQANVYADLNYKDLIGSGIVVTNVSGKIRNYGVRVYGKGSGQPIPLFERPIINNPNIEGTGTSDSEFGVYCGFTGGVVINNPKIRRVGYGVITDEGAQHLKVNDGSIYECQRNAVRFGNISGISDCYVEGTRMYKNNQSGGSGVSSASAVALAFTENCGVIRCKFGLKGEVETQQYSVFIEPSCKNTSISDNHTYSIIAGGVAYVNGGSTDYDINTTGRNNTAESGIALSGGAPVYEIGHLGQRKFTFSGSTGFPASGTWNQGDSLEYSAPLPSGGITNYFGATYTAASGWVNYGATTA